MRKRFRHLVMMMALVLMPIGIMAQTWAGHVAEEGTYYLYNVGKKAFLGGAYDWGTHISVTTQNGISVNLEKTGEGLFKIGTSPTYAGLYMGNNLYVDKSESDEYVTDPWKFELVSGSTDTYTIKETRKNRYLMIKSSSTDSELSASVPTEARGHWQLVTREDYINYLAANATATNPLDATMLLTNANFSRSTDGSGWTDAPSLGGHSQYFCGEKRNTTYNVSQTLSGMPNGVYEMKIQGFYRCGDGTNDASAAAAARAEGQEALNAIYYINGQEHALMSIFDDETHLKTNNSSYNTSSAVTINGTNYYVPNDMNRASECFKAGDYENEPIRVVVTDGTITLGIKKTIVNNQDWTIFDNIRLYYYGVDIDEMKSAAIARWNAYKEITDQALDHSAFDAILAGADSHITSETTLNEYEGIVWNALCELLKTQTTATGQFDITSLIKNPQFDNSIAEWTTNGTIGYDATYGIAEFFGQGDVSISQVLPKMPAGNYTLNAQSFFRSRSIENSSKQYELGIDVVSGALFLGDTSIPVCNIYDQARYVSACPSEDRGGAYQRSVANSLHSAEEAFLIGQYWNVLRTSTTTDGDIPLGLRIAGGSTSCWLPFDNFKLYYGSEKVGLNLVGSEGMPLSDDAYADVTSDITLTAGQYNKICLPFDMDESQTSSTFSHAYQLAGVVSDGSHLTGQLVPAYTIEAGKSYLVTVDATKTLSVNNVRMRVAQPDSIPVMWEGAATIGTYDGFTFDVNLSPDINAPVSQLTFVPVDFNNMNFSVNQENWRARRFLNGFTYTDDMASKISYYDYALPLRVDQPHSVYIPVPQNSGELRVSVSTESDYSDAEVFTFAAGTTLCELPNLIPQNTYYYKVESDGTIVSKGQFNTEGRVRMIKASSSFNIRDLGGRETVDGKRVRYGKIFRGGELNYGHELSEKDKSELLRLGIGAEIDWRRNDETNNENPSVSALGDNVTYLFMNMDYADLTYEYDVNQQKFKQAFEFTLDNLRQGKAVYFHCRIGADRTGAFASLLEGLCGLTFDQLVKDYELTSFSEAGERPWDAEGVNTLITKYNYIKDLPGNNLQEKYFYYCNTILGIPTSDLIEFITIMVDGEPGILNTSSLSFGDEDGICRQSISGIKAICPAGSEVKSGAKAILNDGNTDIELDMSIDEIMISFGDVALAPGTNYTLTIPSGSIEKDGVENAAGISLTFYTPAVFDGIYYLYNQAVDRFLSGGSSFGTTAYTDRYGLPIEWKVGSNGLGTMQFIDSKMYLYGPNWVYIDGSAANAVTFATDISSIDGYNGYRLRNIAHTTGQYLYVRLGEDDGSNYCVAANGLLGDNYKDEKQTVWQFWMKSEHDAFVSDYPLQNIERVIGASGMSTTPSDFLTVLSENYAAIDRSSVIGTTDFSSGVGNWTYAETWGVANYPDYGNRDGENYARLYESTGTYSTTISSSDLPAGIYKLEIGGFERHGNESADISLWEGGFTNPSSSFFAANDEEVQFTSWYQMNQNAAACGESPSYLGQHLAEQAKYVNAGYADNSVYVYLDGTNDLNLTIGIPNRRAARYTVFNNVRLTHYVEKMTISESAPSAPDAKSYANVTLERTLQPEIWNTVSLPFSLTADQINASPLAGSTIYAFKESDATVITFQEVTSMEAGQPYLVKLPESVSESIVNPSFEGVSVESSEGSVQGSEGTVQFIAQIYNKSLEGLSNVCYLSTSGKVKKLSATGNIKGLRSYFIVPESSNDVKLQFETPTGIEQVDLDGSDLSASGVYDLSGRKINGNEHLKSGIYIINGKKTVVR